MIPIRGFCPLSSFGVHIETVLSCKNIKYNKIKTSVVSTHESQALQELRWVLVSLEKIRKLVSLRIIEFSSYDSSLEDSHRARHRRSSRVESTNYVPRQRARKETACNDRLGSHSGEFCKGFLSIALDFPFFIYCVHVLS